MGGFRPTGQGGCAAIQNRCPFLVAEETYWMTHRLADTLLWSGREQPSEPKEADTPHPELPSSSSHPASQLSAQGKEACVSGPAFHGARGKALHGEKLTLIAGFSSESCYEDPAACSHQAFILDLKSLSPADL